MIQKYKVGDVVNAVYGGKIERLHIVDVDGAAVQEYIFKEEWDYNELHRASECDLDTWADEYDRYMAFKNNLEHDKKMWDMHIKD